MGEVEIRTLTESDTRGFLELKRIALSTDPFSFVASPDEDPPDYPQRVSDRLRTASVANGDVIVGAFAPELVGIVAITRDAHAKRRHKADLHGMYVRPDCRGRGLGRTLLVEVLRLSSQMPDLETIQLIVATHNREAAALYHRFGFVDVWTELRALKVAERCVDAHHMALTLPAAFGGQAQAQETTVPPGRLTPSLQRASPGLTTGLGR